MKRRSRRSALSIKSERQLEKWGVERLLAGRPGAVGVGPCYRLADERVARLVIMRDAEGDDHVGYAVREEGQWEVAETDRYSARALGYYRRRLARIGMPERERRSGEKPEVIALSADTLSEEGPT